MPFSNNHQETLKKRVIPDKTWALHRARMQVERKRGEERAWGSAFIGAQGGGLGFRGLTL